mmetsp:Transcript_32407/g.62396  ORF Transcript_32407/g.62396 Transcript_32407/m.62396 type:complete len:247 (+) Transcript_32407:170-910(+)
MTDQFQKQTELAMAARADDLWQAAEASRLPEAYTEVLMYLKAETQADGAPASLKWRLARAYKDCAKFAETQQEKKVLIMQGLEQARSATAADPSDFKGFLWTGIMLGQSADHVGLRDKVGSAFGIRDAFKKATELNPLDAESEHCLGQWCYALASMNWIERKASAAIGLHSSYEEALTHFLRATELKDKYITNLLHIAKCYDGLGQHERAAEFAAKVLEIEAISPDDVAARVEATALQEKLKRKRK